MCRRDKPERKHTVMSVVGLSVSAAELILASIYNFSMVGFGLSLIGLVTSGLYLHFNLRNSRAPEDVVQSVNSSQQMDNEEISKKELSKTTQILMAKQREEERKSVGCTYQILWVCYVIFVVFLCFQAVLRFDCLIRRSTWRHSLEGQFPSACGDWAAA
jgi:hypothetical protein